MKLSFSKFRLAFAILAIAILTTGCTYKGSQNSIVDISKTDMSTISEMKSGESCVSSIFFFIPTGLDATAQSAAKNGGIKEIKYQEILRKNYLIYNAHCIKVYGN
ncbi:hypothetical protein CRU86_06810 [Aliarcobacter skirrowii]|jgi:hypothetical protein|uniref:TRL domain-containing protein n=1 Tax=Aliarcobacter skirrowii TaxID=28200 RepID=UPI00100B3966|nr:TRL domain-containing protein [Aliarcobacter skirrowii]RXJ76907.1 hypothetical protein CRU86_06810 [Aliarcobacter skirrowii]